MKVKLFTKYVASLCLLVFSVNCWSQEQATVLPDGITRIRMVGIKLSPFDVKFNRDGKRESLVSPLNKSVRSDQMINSLKSSNTVQSQEKVQKLNSLKEMSTAHGLTKSESENLLSVDLETVTQIEARQTVIAIEHGLSNRLTLGIKIPYIWYRNTTRFRSKLNARNLHKMANAIKNETVDYDKAVKIAHKGVGFFKDVLLWALPNKAAYNLSIKSKVRDGMQEFSSTAMQSVLSSGFSAKGYDTPHSFEIASLGDIEFGGKYRYYNSKFYRGAAQIGFRLPTTTHEPIESNLLDKGVADDQLDLGFALFQDIQPVKNLHIGAFAEYVYQFSDRMQKHVYTYASEPQFTRVTPADGLPPVNNDYYLDRDIRRKLGNQLNTELNVAYTLMDGVIKPHVAYQYKRKGTDSYSGSKAHLDYSTLSTDSDVTSHSWQVGLNLSTIPYVKNKSFDIPAELRLKYNKRFAGINTPEVAYARADLIIYFR